MDKQQFDDAIGVVPPSTVDVDAIITRQRRAAMVRRVAAPGIAAAAGVVAVTFGIAIALPGAPTQSGGTVPGSQPVAVEPTTTVPTSVQPVPATPQPPTGSQRPLAGPLPCKGGPEDVPTAAARLSAAMTVAVRRHIPDAELIANPGANFGSGKAFGPLEFFLVGTGSEYDFNPDCMPREGYFLARATVSDPAGRGAITALLDADDPFSSDPACGTPASQPELQSCTEGTGPNGEIYIVSKSVTQQGQTIHRVDFLKPDGTGGLVESQNVGTDVKTGDPVERQTPPLTLEQLVAIALDPGLSLFPPR